MERENYFWGAPRIHGELLMLGFTVSQATVSRWHAHQALSPTARRTGLLPGQRARGAICRAHRLDAPPDHSWNARDNRPRTAVPIRSPPYEARASPRPWSSATQDAIFRVDQVLRRHRQGKCDRNSSSTLRALVRKFENPFVQIGRNSRFWAMGSQNVARRHLEELRCAFSELFRGLRTNVQTFAPAI
jgi:hypothetical protein